MSRQRLRRRRDILFSGPGLPGLVFGQQLDDPFADAVQVRAKRGQDLSGHAFARAQQAEQDVLGADVAVPQQLRLAQRQLEDLLGARGERNVPGP
jgi:hypothetical protein